MVYFTGLTGITGLTGFTGGATKKGPEAPKGPPTKEQIKEWSMAARAYFHKCY